MSPAAGWCTFGIGVVLVLAALAWSYFGVWGS